MMFPPADFSFPLCSSNTFLNETRESDFMRNRWKHAAPSKKKNFLKYGKVHTLQAVAHQVSETPRLRVCVCVCLQYYSENFRRIS